MRLFCWPPGKVIKVAKGARAPRVQLAAGTSDRIRHFAQTVSGSALAVTGLLAHRRAWCQPPLTLTGGLRTVPPLLRTLTPPPADSAIARAFRLFLRACGVSLRCLQLAWIFGPTLLLYPVARLVGGSTHDWWWLAARRCIERAGPACVKFFQWASTRRDLFSAGFCDFFGNLHSHNRAHPLAHSEAQLTAAFGPGWTAFLTLDPTPVGVGCVGQVHRGMLRCDDGRAAAPMEVAVKIMHPDILNMVARDLDIMRIGVWLIECVPRLRWLAMGDCLEEFAALLVLQLDFRHEAKNLAKFQRQFRTFWWEKFSFRALFSQGGEVIFPTPVIGWVAQHVLVESYIPGLQVSQIIPIPDAKLKQRISRIGVDVFVRMIFEKNFVHGDLHPGNILVCGLNTAGTEIADERGFKLALLDAGIVSTLSPADYKNFAELFYALLQKDGHRAGRLILERSRFQQCDDPDQFVEDMAALVNKVVNSGLILNRIDVGSLLQEALAVACRHRVRLESNFTSVILSIMVLEGVGRSLDPDMDLLKAATPYIIGAVEGRVKHWLYFKCVRLARRLTGAPATHPNDPDHPDADAAANDDRDNAAVGLDAQGRNTAGAVLQ